MATAVDNDRNKIVDFALSLLKADSDYKVKGFVIETEAAVEELFTEEETEDFDGDSLQPRPEKIFIDADRMKWFRENKDVSIDEFIKDEMKKKEEIPDFEPDETAVFQEADIPYKRAIEEEDIEEGDELQIVRPEKNTSHVLTDDPEFVPAKNDYAVLVELNDKGDKRDWFLASSFKKKE